MANAHAAEGPSQTRPSRRRCERQAGVVSAAWLQESLRASVRHTNGTSLSVELSASLQPLVVAGRSSLQAVAVAFLKLVPFVRHTDATRTVGGAPRNGPRNLLFQLIGPAVLPAIYDLAPVPKHAAVLLPADAGPNIPARGVRLPARHRGQVPLAGIKRAVRLRRVRVTARLPARCRESCRCRRGPAG